MTVEQLLEELEVLYEQGYGQLPVMWMNLNIQELVEVEHVEVLPYESGVKIG